MVQTTEKKAQDETLRQRIQELIDRKEIDQTGLAKKIGYSGAALSTYLKGDYRGSVENFETELKKFLSTFKENKTQLKTVLDFVETSVSKNIFNAAKLCQYNGEMGVCFGASGLGKTTAIKAYQKEKSGVIYVDPDENTSPRAVLKQIATQLKLPNFSQYMETFIDDIVKRLYGTGYIIIVDEAENLNSKMFRILRKIHDRCNGTIGILFVGTEVLYGNLLKLQGEYIYILNRIAYCVKLDYLSASDVSNLVKQVFPDITDTLLIHFENVTNRNARVLFNTLKRAKDIVNTSKEALNKDIIDTARGFLLVTKMRGI